MLAGSRCELPGFKKLENSEHFQTLNRLFLLASGDIENIIDLGCGAAEFGRIYSFFDYVGADLPHIIENVAKKKNPNLSFYNFDAYKTDYKFLKKYDLILMNAFISELSSADLILEKVLTNAKKYVLIHRQKLGMFKEKNIKYTEYRGYLNREYTCSVFSEKYLEDLIAKKGFRLVKSLPSDTPEEVSFLLKRII